MIRTSALECCLIAVLCKLTMLTVHQYTSSVLTASDIRLAGYQILLPENGLQEGMSD